MRTEPKPAHPEPLVWSFRARSSPQGRTCWRLRQARAQERRRCGAGSHSVVSRAQCLCHRAEGEKGHMVSAAPRSCWPSRLLVPGQPQGQKSSHVGCTAPGLLMKSWLTGTKGAARPEAHETWDFTAFVSSFPFPQHKGPPPSPASPYL